MPSTILGDQALSLPNGTLANRPAGASLGTMRYNTTGNNAEVLTSQGWASFGELPGYSISAPADSALAIQTANPTATNGLYWIRQTGSTAYQHYCVFTNAAGASIAGGPWTVPLRFNRNSGDFSSDPETAAGQFRTWCSEVGINTPGRGMDTSRTTTEVYGAWLATKRAMWNAHSSFISGKSSGGGGVLVMPVMKDTSLTLRTVDSSRPQSHVPPNGDGDVCNEGGGQYFCGWWGSNDVASWTTNNDAIPGPEDWAYNSGTNSSYGYTGFLPLVVACTYR
jgi:hypothetical protein